MSRLMVLQCDGPDCKNHGSMTQAEYERRRVGSVIAPEAILPAEWRELHFCSLHCMWVFAEVTLRNATEYAPSQPPQPDQVAQDS